MDSRWSLPSNDLIEGGNDKLWAIFLIFIFFYSLTVPAFCEDEKSEDGKTSSAKVQMIEERFRSLSGSLQGMPAPPDMKDKQIQLPGDLSSWASNEKEEEKT